MMNSFHLFVEYLGRIWPAFLLLLLSLAFSRPPAFGRVVLYIVGFVVCRDVMASLGFWFPSTEGGVLRFLFTDDALLLVLLSLLFFAAMLVFLAFDRENRDRCRFFSNDRGAGIFVGLLAGFCVAAPLLFFQAKGGTEAIGPEFRVNMALPLLCLSLSLAFIEEGLFRGYLLAFLKDHQSSLLAGVSSGILFAFSYLPLALTGSGLSLPLLLFVLWEGVITGTVGSRYGVFPSCVTHGVAIFLISAAFF
ncbi:CPBP family glutamic-type intramembrane protease [Sediminispirochaeta bajacaliforniensis]|uniref:CPBP family glutamic-type intramembrane protease n=1 Tax=Sediminispirochaeta bajacaliforniensis TaxID=148 RepID=UPI00039D70E2|nr:CPBP family glutamic-type intramembrane protease [Sediminispirochaeta bajacaliforniensis]